MRKADIIYNIRCQMSHVSLHDIEIGVNSIIETFMEGLERGEHIEIRGFGSFNVVSRKPMLGRNPRTGDLVEVGVKRRIMFKAGKELRKNVNDSRLKYKITDL